jgi:hypothetical protein
VAATLEEKDARRKHAFRAVSRLVAIQHCFRGVWYMQNEWFEYHTYNVCFNLVQSHTGSSIGARSTPSGDVQHVTTAGLHGCDEDTMPDDVTSHAWFKALLENKLHMRLDIGPDCTKITKGNGKSGAHSVEAKLDHDVVNACFEVFDHNKLDTASVRLLMSFLL